MDEKYLKMVQAATVGELQEEMAKLEQEKSNLQEKLWPIEQKIEVIKSMGVRTGMKVQYF